PAACGSRETRAGAGPGLLEASTTMDTMDLIIQLLIPAVLVLVALLAIGIVLARLYRRSEKDRAYVRTGFGGQKVVLDGGALVLPVFHSIAFVNLQTLRLDVRRDNAEAMRSEEHTSEI